jgi:hypothetical protein
MTYKQELLPVHKIIGAGLLMALLPLHETVAEDSYVSVITGEMKSMEKVLQSWHLKRYNTHTHILLLHP